MLRSIRIFLLSIALCTTAGAAAAPARDADLRSLQAEVQQLKTQQQQMLDSLNEIKQILKRGAEPPGVDAPEKMSVAGELFRGAADAQLAIIEYADFECPFCRRFHNETYAQIENAYIKTGKLRYFYRDLPLPFHQHALPAARAVRCAADQGKFWQMHDSLFSGNSELTDAEIRRRAGSVGIELSKFVECLKSNRFTDVIQQSVNDAARMRINGTPTFILGTIDSGGDVVSVKGTVIGAQSFDAFRAALDPLLQARTAPVAERRGSSDRFPY